MTIQHQKPNFDEAMRRIREVMQHIIDDEAHKAEIDMQQVAVALGRNPALVYPDYKERNGPEYWYICRKADFKHRRVFKKSEEDWVCPLCDIDEQ